MFVNSTVKLDFGTIRKLERAQIIALEQTAEYLHTEVVQAQVVPFDKGVLQGEAMAPDYSRSSQGCSKPGTFHSLRKTIVLSS